MSSIADSTWYGEHNGSETGSLNNGYPANSEVESVALRAFFNPKEPIISEIKQGPLDESVQITGGFTVGAAQKPEEGVN